MSELKLRIIVGVLLAILAVCLIGIGGYVFALSAALIAGLVFREWRGLTGSSFLWQLAGFFYALLPALALTLLRLSPNGIWLVTWIVAVTAATDIGAFFAGRLIGGPKLWPILSPKKTWSGLLGGMISAAIFAYLIADFAHLPFFMKVIGAPMAIIAQAGDFFESWLKRRAHVKDSGHLLPGHGGIMDRVDGLSPVALLTAILIKIGAFAS
ncbi:MAG: phosphatidate cytidylyltransferase [Zymomonas mobilis subsp. pomaceae]|uniref:Phosphatidate cytidylyltransferase n=1 Tax=Zymomonas mobilis subsp. pomaceae (strain ATCC 29192 / DSM 22645 / JCM 10191 / CCUG 17912 / NBRC 13757 / NCIMB 11200 / NRRL B-4491 / Barker I) TaxID=579138 RepID=F8ETP0_ZYMMT|nr:phosphatidate cytidylyltransferase [Zymomonas mobilis]AEI37050.1 phosphatidate cytidylyltransferase [Zymomonas mobilis subsp. pomaceae ATCC 29192]MDX5948422.1 phosphatidate cytidylyltransferase [Zymomonas mobilis subsp. pomaceae]GEB89588.1 hypothetical protein ZMO02_12250 [Zymomonas mobilis subsp. pomaceae]